MSQGPHIWQSGIIQFRIMLQPRMKLQAMLAQPLVWEKRNWHRHFSRILITTKYHIHPQLYKNRQEECNSPTPWKHILREKQQLTPHQQVHSLLCRVPHIVDSCAVVVARVLHTDPPDGEVASLHEAVERHWAGRVGPYHFWLWVTTCQRALHSDVVTRVDHQSLIDRQLQSRWGWKSTKRDTSEAEKDPSTCLCTASYFYDLFLSMAGLNRDSWKDLWIDYKYEVFVNLKNDHYHVFEWEHYSFMARKQSRQDLALP